MSSIARPVIIPSEIQAREFDAKLLLACFLAEGGVTAYVGARHEIHANLHRLPPSLYVAKDFRRTSNRIFGIMDLLGHKIVAWDEEGLLTIDREVYYELRVDPSTISLVREFYAWGAPNKALTEDAPGFPGVSIHITGNPRIDLLRPELRNFHAEVAKQLKGRFGKFILINTNFGVANHVVRSKTVRPGKPNPYQRYAPMPGLDDIFRHRAELFQVFLELLPRIAGRFAEHTIVVRPHPTESHAVWKNAAKDNDNVRVIHEGPALPWLLAAGVMIHNGCTTGLESFLLDRPSIMFEPKRIRPTISTLSNVLSHCIDTEQKLFETIAGCFETGRPLPQSKAQWDRVNEVLAATNGPLASERIAGHICGILNTVQEDGINSPMQRFSGQIRSRKRKLEKLISGLLAGHKTGKVHNRHRYPSLSVDEVAGKIGRLSKVLGRFDGVHVQPVQGQIFRVEKDAP